VIADGLKRDIDAQPTQASDQSWLHVIDWRNRGPKLSLKMSKPEREAWWREQHPDLDLPNEPWG
jgi:hypothetical protein